MQMTDLSPFLRVFDKTIYILYAAHQLFICNLYFLPRGAYIEFVPACGAGTVEKKIVSLTITGRARQTSPRDQETVDVSPRVRAVGNILRIAFIVCLLVLTVRVSMPQNETIWTAYDTLGDLVRLTLGFAVCLWLAVQLFRARQDAHGHRMWIYFGLLGVPFAILCLITTW